MVGACNFGDGIGVIGTSHSGDGVRGVSDSGNGVYAHSSGGAAALLAVGGIRAERGRFGVDVQVGDGSIAAVRCRADGTDGIGVDARGTIGVHAEGGTALKVDGRAEFSQSGIVVVPSGSATVIVYPDYWPTSATFMLATIQDDRPGLHVASAVPTSDGDGFTIKLNQPADADTRVGWFVVN